MKTLKNRPFHHHDHLVYSCQYHIVFCPKYRCRILVNGIHARLKELFPLIAADLGGAVLEMEIMPDHVHLLVDIDPRVGIDAFVGSLKRRSSFVIRTEFPHIRNRLSSLWTRGKFIATVGSVSLEVVKRYIRNQKAS